MPRKTNKYFNTGTSRLKYYFIYFTEHSHTDYHRLIHLQPSKLRIHHPHIIHGSHMDITHTHRLQASQFYWQIWAVWSQTCWWQTASTFPWRSTKFHENSDHMWLSQLTKVTTWCCSRATCCKKFWASEIWHFILQ
jgi:nitrous oxide reductase